MKDGFLNKCKECTKVDSLKNYNKKSENPDFVLKERIRSKEKYHRLNYKVKQRIIDKKFPWKENQVYKNLNRKLKIQSGFEAHHWNYNSEFIIDVIVLSRKQHKNAHRFLTLNESMLIFETKEGVLLDTKAKHIQYLLDKGIFN